MLSFTQLCSKLDRVLGTDSVSYPLADKAVDCNIALQEVFALALKTAGWNVDDFNHEKYNIITTNLVSGQRDYSFTYDEQGNLILGIYAVFAKNAASGVFKKLEAVDQQRQDEDITGKSMEYFWDGNDTQGVPTRYDKTADGIFLDPIPSYSSSNGLKVMIDREPSYFTAYDFDGTTKIAGIDGLCHDYLYLKPAYEWARDKGLSSAERLYRDLLDARQKVYDRYGMRERDVLHRLIPKVDDCR